jgi:hypothetical protein
MKADGPPLRYIGERLIEPETPLVLRVVLNADGK